MKIQPRQIALTGIMLSISAVLFMTGLGMIPVPTAAGYATIMHIPVVIIAILEGPIIGAIAGFLFGLIAYYFVPQYGPIVHLVPRPFIGIFAALAYQGLTMLFEKWKVRNSDALAIGIAAFTGSITNTVGVLSLAVIFFPKIFPPAMALTIAVTGGLPEAVVTTIAAVPVVITIKKVFSRFYGSKMVEAADNV